MKRDYEITKKLFLTKKNILILAVTFFALLIFALLIFAVIQLNKNGIDDLTSYSYKSFEDGAAIFSLNVESGYIYKAKGEGQEAVNEFLINRANVNGRLLPPDFHKNASTIRISKDSELPLEITINSSTKEHYFLEQSINGIPVYGSSLIVHLQNKNEIYAVSGSILTNGKLTEKKITDDEAVQKALNAANKEVIEGATFSSFKKGNYIINLKLLGVSDDSTNYLTFGVQVDSYEYNFSTLYFVNFENGEIVYKEDLIYEAKQREVYDCKKNLSSPNCPIGRRESDPPIGDEEVDNMHENMGIVYDYYLNIFDRDGLDGNGSPLKAYVNIATYPTSKGPARCDDYPNAVHNSDGTLAYCPGVTGKDVVAHEFTHGVVATSARLVRGYQHSALNESIADSFANALDNNWTMGEGTVLGIIRNMSNPPSVSSGPGLGNQPDKLFSPSYDCASEEEHHNAGVPNKAFYLMTDGGTFNGCTISGIGSVRSHAILYKALTQYMTPTSNFYTMYSAINLACNDLYGSSSSECKEAQKAYQATQMDQQPTTSARGPRCMGVAEKPATCSNSPTSPPITGIPTTTISVPTVGPGTPTATPKQGVPTATPKIPIGQIPTVTPTPGGKFELNGTPTPTPDQYFSCLPDPNCAKSGKTIQLCPLICEPQMGGGGRLPGATIAPTSATSGITPTISSGNLPTTTLSVPTPTTKVSNSPTVNPTNISVDIASVVNSVSEINIRSYMQNLVDDDDVPGPDETQTRYTGSSGNSVETDYVRSKFAEFGLSASFQPFSASGLSTRNVIGKIDGKDPNSVYLITSHIDSTAQQSGTTDPAPGADDNASGSVAVMEAARALNAIKSQLKTSIEFITFSGEEQGLFGSYYYVKNRPTGKIIKGVINLDMIGNNSGSECVNFHYKNYNGGDVISSKIVAMITKYNIGITSVSMASSNGLSDHKPFWDVGIPAVFGFECTFSPVYHSINDKTNAINYSQITKTTKAVVAAIAELATQ